MSRFDRTLDQRGFTLVEMLVAVLLVSVIMLATYQAFDAGNRLYVSGESQAELQQRTRVGLDLMLEELREAGFDYNRDGHQTGYPDSPDEQIEYLAPRAITFRGNFDFGDAESGREPDYEVGPDEAAFGVDCCPIVTTSNDEIVTYALRSHDNEANLDDIELHFDTSVPRDAIRNEDGSIANEETVVIENVDLDGGDAPYTLIRFSLNDAGEVVENALVDNIHDLVFTYKGIDGNDTHCLSLEDDGSCQPANEVRFDEAGGDDSYDLVDLDRRRTRANVRRISVNVVAMAGQDDFRFVDEGDATNPHRRKFQLSSTVLPLNLGVTGSPDLFDEEVGAPKNVTICTGQCNTVRVEWETPDRAREYIVHLWLKGEAEPFFSAVTPGVLVPDSYPQRAYAIYQRTDHTSISDLARMTATVQARTVDDEISPHSARSLEVGVVDTVRPEAPLDVVATGYDPTSPGWPNVAENLVAPDTTGTGPEPAMANKIVVSWVPPQFALDIRDPSKPAEWTTQVDSSTLPALSCDSFLVDTDGDTTPDKERTQLREMIGEGEIRYYVFRSENPRFVPTAADVVGEISGQVNVVEGRILFIDETDHLITPSGFKKTNSTLENCRTYYYRVRAVDDCYTGTDAASLIDHHLSPFFPPLNPDPTVDDSDDISKLTAAEIGPAIPGFAIPQARPRAPENVEFRHYEIETKEDPDADATIGFDVVKQDSHVLADGTPAPNDITISRYHVYTHPTNPDFSIDDAIAQANGVVLEHVIDVWDLEADRIDHDDENGDAKISPDEDESVLPTPWPDKTWPVSGLRMVMDPLAPKWYRVAAVTCTDDDTVPSSLDPDAFDYGHLSTAVSFPCLFGGGAGSWIDVTDSLFPNSVTATAIVDDPIQPAQTAQLVLVDRLTGATASTPEPGVSVNAFGEVTFWGDHIAELTQQLGTNDVDLYVRMTDTTGCFGRSDVSTPPPPVLASCCLAPAVPFANGAKKRGTVTVVESCGLVPLTFTRIVVDLDNANSGQFERIERIDFNKSLIWTGSTTYVDISLAGESRVLAPGEELILAMDFSRDATADNITVTYFYLVDGVEYSCTFTGTLL